MKNKKLIIGIIIGIVVVVISILGLIIFNNIKDKETLNGNYMTKGEYYLHFIKEVNMYLNDYEEEDYESDKGEEIAAHTMYEHYLIEKDQTKKLNKPVTREIVAQSLVRYMEFRTEHDVEILDINNCVDKQAIIDAVGMGIFELENGKFNPNGYMTAAEVEKAIEKMNDIELNSHYPENGWENEGNETAPADKWEDLKITLNKKEYKITKNMKVSDFVNNGWKATYGEETLNQTMEEIQKSMQESAQLYIGYNLVYFEQDNLSLGVYFDMSSPKTKVIDSRVIAITVYSKDEKKSSDFEFLGLKLGEVITEKDYKKIFGEKNFVMLEDDKNHYYRKSIELSDDFEVGLEFTTRVDTNKLVSITISENQ